MSNIKKYFLIFLFSIVFILVTYSVASSFFQKNMNFQVQDVPFYKKILVEKEPAEPISLLFTGDIMLDRTIRKDGELYGYKNLFSCLETEFKKYDEVIGNLEGTITNNKSVSRDAEFLSPESYRFTFDKKAVQDLVDTGLSIVSIGNNHIRDFGEAGIDETLASAFEINLEVFGDPRTMSQKYLIKNIKGNIIAFIPYNQFLGTKEQTLQDLKEVKEISDLQIIFAHWGEEYVPAQEQTKMIAHAFVNNGADLVIGAHPHVVQEHEIYNNVGIFYSLGNFIFDQYWEETVRSGLAVNVLIKNKKIISTEKLFTESVRHKGTCFKNTPSAVAQGGWGRLDE